MDKLFIVNIMWPEGHSPSWWFKQHEAEQSKFDVKNELRSFAILPLPLCWPKNLSPLFFRTKEAWEGGYCPHGSVEGRLTFQQAVVSSITSWHFYNGICMYLLKNRKPTLYYLAGFLKSLLYCRALVAFWWHLMHTYTLHTITTVHFWRDVKIPEGKGNKVNDTNANMEVDQYINSKYLHPKRNWTFKFRASPAQKHWRHDNSMPVPCNETHCPNKHIGSGFRLCVLRTSFFCMIHDRVGKQANSFETTAAADALGNLLAYDMHAGKWCIAGVLQRKGTHHCIDAMFVCLWACLPPFVYVFMSRYVWTSIS